MNLISCPTCGVVYNKDHLDFSISTYIDFEGKERIDPLSAYWDGDEYKAMVRCRVCEIRFTKDGDTI